MMVFKYIPLFSLLIICLNTFGQLSSVQVKKLKLRALEVALKYETSCAITNFDQIDDFIKLFESSDVEVLNDVLPENRLESKISLKDYIDLQNSYFTLSIRTSFKPYDVVINESNSNEGKIEVLGLKTISGKENKSQMTYLDTLDIKISMKYNYNRDEIKITTIDLVEKPTRYLILDVRKKTLLKSDTLKNTPFIINGNRAVTSNSDGMIFLSKIDIGSDLKIELVSESQIGNRKVTSSQINGAIRSTKDKNRVLASYYYSVMDIGVMIGSMPWFAPPFAYENAINENISSMDYGISLGIAIDQSKKGYLKIRTGVHTFDYNFKSTIDPINYAYQSIDPDGAQYTRMVEIMQYAETTSLNGMYIPLLLEKGLTKNKLGVFVNAGTSYNSIRASESTSTASALYSGYYPEYFNMSISENGVYDFGMYELMNNNTIKARPYFWALQFGFGCLYSVKRSNITFGLAYKRNLTDILETDNQMLSEHSNQLNSLNEIGQKTNLSTLLVNFGIQFKI